MTPRRVIAVVALLVAATVGGCGEDKPTYGGGFDSVEECIDGWRTLDPDLTLEERRAECTEDGEDRPPPGGGGDELRTCPESLEVLAERHGGGFVRGVDPEYDSAMDWDGDGVSCE